ncbi:MAG: sensor histidine kinase [Alkalispirochaeta sp.]
MTEPTIPYRLFAEAFHRSKTLFAVLDGALTIRHVNRAFADSVAMDITELVDRPYFEIFPDDDQQTIFESVLATGEEYFAKGVPHVHTRRRDDAITYRNVQLVPVANEEGMIDNLVLIVSDVTEEVLLRKELEYNYSILRSLFEHSSVAVVRADAEWRHLFANHTYYALFNLDGERCIGSRIDEVGLDPSFVKPWKNALDRTATTKERSVFRFEVASGDGGRIAYQGEVNPELRRNGEIDSYVTFLNDITVVQDREEELENLLIEMNHRIKNNLGTIEALARVELLAGDKSKEGAIEDIISRISAIGQVHETLYETRSFSRVRLGEYLRELLDSLLAGAGTGPGTFSPRIDYDEIEVSSKVATKVGLMLAELTTNTIKYAACSGNCEILVSARAIDRGVTIVYRDTGRGFPPEITSIDDLSTGTGMMILKALIEDLDGSVKLDTSLHPARFLIRFPLDHGPRRRRR